MLNIETSISDGTYIEVEGERFEFENLSVIGTITLPWAGIQHTVYQDRQTGRYIWCANLQKDWLGTDHAGQFRYRTKLIEPSEADEIASTWGKQDNVPPMRLSVELRRT